MCVWFRRSCIAQEGYVGSWQACVLCVSACKMAVVQLCCLCLCECELWT